MLDRILDNLKNAPSRLADRGATLRSRARTRVQKARGNSQERFWTFRVGALERAEELLTNAPDVPVVGNIADAAERLVHKSLEATVAVPLADYDELGAKKIGVAVRTMGRIGLLRTRRYELANKNRKTVLAAIDKELERQERELNAAA